MYTRKLWIIFPLILLCTLFSSCDWSLETGESLPMLHQVSPVDTTPEQLSIVINLTEDQNARDGKVSITMQFIDNGIRNPNDVQFTDQESIICNGVPLTYDSSAYNYSASIISTSNNYTCLYTSHGQTSTLAIPIQTQLSPTYILHDKQLNVQYNVSDSSNCTIQVEVSDSNHTQDGPIHPDNGLYPALDISNFSGPGNLSFSRTCSTIQPSAFHKITLAYQASRSIPVNWKNS
jgi:hypothetical protein